MSKHEGKREQRRSLEGTQSLNEGKREQRRSLEGIQSLNAAKLVAGGGGESALESARSPTIVTAPIDKMSDRRKMSVNSEARSATEAIQLLLTNLDKEVLQPTVNNVNMNYAKDLLNEMGENRAAMEGDLASVLVSYQQGLISVDHLNTMIENERARTEYVVNETSSMKSALDMLFERVQKMADSFPSDDSQKADEMDDIAWAVQSVCQNFGQFNKVIKTPAREVKQLVGDIKVKSQRKELQQVHLGTTKERLKQRDDSFKKKVVMHEPSRKAFNDWGTNTDEVKLFDFGVNTDHSWTHTAEYPPNHPLHFDPDQPDNIHLATIGKSAADAAAEAIIAKGTVVRSPHPFTTLTSLNQKVPTTQLI